MNAILNMIILHKRFCSNALNPVLQDSLELEQTGSKSLQLKNKVLLAGTIYEGLKRVVLAIVSTKCEFFGLLLNCTLVLFIEDPYNKD